MHGSPIWPMEIHTVRAFVVRAFTIALATGASAVAAVAAGFPPLVRLPLLDEAAPAANLPIRQVHSARVRFAASNHSNVGAKQWQPHPNK